MRCLFSRRFANLTAALSLLVTAGTAAQPAGDFKLVFSEEFCCTAGAGQSGALAKAPVATSGQQSQGGLDLSKWTYDIGTGDGGWGNGEPQYYTARKENSFITTDSSRERCIVTIRAIREAKPFFDMPFTSARFTTRNHPVAGQLKPPAGGSLYIEARMLLPESSNSGTWPAFWALPTDNVYGDWPASGEIDIMEAAAQMRTTLGSIHFGPDFAQHQNVTYGTSCNSTVDAGRPALCNQGWHTWSLTWEESGMSWALDNVTIGSVTADRWRQAGAAADSSAPFDQSFYLILNLAAGGTFSGQPSSDLDVRDLQIDYVRVYQSPSTSGGPAVNATCAYEQSPQPGVVAGGSAGGSSVSFSTRIALTGYFACIAGATLLAAL